MSTPNIFMICRKAHLPLVILLVATVALAACQPIQAPVEPEGPQLATAKVDVQLSNQVGRAIVSARGNHFVVDSVPPLDGPNEELNPLDMLLGALATCGIFVAERAAQELELPLESATALVEGDLDPQGVRGEPVDPRIQAFRVFLDLPGVDAEQIGALIDNFISRCPMYTTLSRAAPVEILIGGEAATPTADGLATASVTAQLSNQPGRAIVSARGNHFVIDSVPPLEGPNEERNPLDLFLGALGTCGGFIYEWAAEEMGIPLTGLDVTVEGDFDPRGVAAAVGSSDDTGDYINPRIQALRVNLHVVGPNAEQAEMLEAEFMARCPIYTTLSRSAPIEIVTEIEAAAEM